MRKRDLAILMLCAFAIFFSLQHEGDFSFREAWFHLSEEYPIKYEAERLPPPLVADLNGDGKKEILVATHDAKIQENKFMAYPQANLLLLLPQSLPCALAFWLIYLRYPVE